MAQPIALVSGVGPGTGTSLVRRFAAGGYRVAMLARSRERLEALAATVPDTLAVPCDVADERQVDAAVATVRSRLGDPAVLIHNAVGGAFGTFLDVDPAGRGHRPRVDASVAARRARRLLLQAGRHRRRGLARRPSAAVGVVVQRRGASVRRALVAGAPPTHEGEAA